MEINAEELISDFLKVAELSNIEFIREDIVHDVRRAPHKAGTIPLGIQAVYVISLTSNPSKVLKVGKNRIIFPL